MAGFATISVHYHLKDAFKAAFRSATWDSSARTWKVAASSRAAALAWVEQHEPAKVAAEKYDRICRKRRVRQAQDMRQDCPMDWERVLPLRARRALELEAAAWKRFQRVLQAAGSARKVETAQVKAIADQRKLTRGEAAASKLRAEGQAILLAAAPEFAAALDAAGDLLATGALTPETLRQARSVISSVRMAASRLGVASEGVEAIFVHPTSISPASLAAARDHLATWRDQKVSA